MDYPTYLIHYGTLGQKWGVRKYQNEDGTWTEEGLRRRRKYVSDSGDLTRSGEKYYKKLQKEKDRTQKLYSANSRRLIDLQNSYPYETEEQRQYNDYLFKRVFNQTVKNIEYSKIIDSELEAIGQKYLTKAKGLDKSIDDIFIETNKNGEKTIKFKTDEEDKQDEQNEQNDIKKIENIIKDADILESTSKIWWLEEDKADEFFKQNKRISDATDLAMKALGKDGLEKYAAYAKYITSDGKPSKYSLLLNSFNYPDETKASGLVQIADLANRGYNKDQIMKIVDSSGDIALYSNDHITTKDHDTLYAIGAYSSKAREDFIDKCCKLAQSNTLSDAKQSRIKSLIASGKSQEEVAKMLGVSTSTVNKYK